MIIEETYVMETAVAYTKGHVDIKEFIKAVKEADFYWYEDFIEEDESVSHDYARRIPWKWFGEKYMNTWVGQKPGRGAFPITRTDY